MKRWRFSKRFSAGNTAKPESLLVSALRYPESILRLAPSDWEVLVRQARSANLLARLSVQLAERGLLEQIPLKARNHLQSAQAIADRQGNAVRWEVKQVQEALADSGIPLLLLKGSAYLMAELPLACGRMFGDIDILVPKAKLDEAEKALMLRGWSTTHHDVYDQRYYRTWMHELPPLRHVRRHSTLDIHHAILPGTARLRPNSSKLIESAHRLEKFSGVYVLAPVDMVLHSATHLFHEGEFHNGLRDLVDLGDLLRHFGQDRAFWAQLVQRARDLELTRPLYYALGYANSVLATPVPEEVWKDAQVGKPCWPGPALMRFLFSRVLMPSHPSCKTAFSGLARWALYVRAHYLRMPAHLLIPHLVRKSLRLSSDA